MEKDRKLVLQIKHWILLPYLVYSTATVYFLPLFCCQKSTWHREQSILPAFYSSNFFQQPEILPSFSVTVNNYSLLVPLPAIHVLRIPSPFSKGNVSVILPVSWDLGFFVCWFLVCLGLGCFGFFFLSLLFSWVLVFALTKNNKTAHYFLHISSLTGFYIQILFRLANTESCFLYCLFHHWAPSLLLSTFTSW